MEFSAKMTEPHTELNFLALPSMRCFLLLVPDLHSSYTYKCVSIPQTKPSNVTFGNPLICILRGGNSSNEYSNKSLSHSCSFKSADVPGRSTSYNPLSSLVNIASLRLSVRMPSASYLPLCQLYEHCT